MSLSWSLSDLPNTGAGAILDAGLVSPVVVAAVAGADGEVGEMDEVLLLPLPQAPTPAASSAASSAAGNGPIALRLLPSPPT
jgi:hypothetical protein